MALRTLEVKKKKVGLLMSQRLGLLCAQPTGGGEAPSGDKKGDGKGRKRASFGPGGTPGGFPDSEAGISGCQQQVITKLRTREM